MSFKCLIVDDEPIAHKVLENYIQKLDKLEVVHNCYNAIEAINYLYENTVDLIFLDINMPELTGLEMLKTLNDPPSVILTTAYSDYAIEGYEFGVLDYLLKPIRFDRFLKAVNRFLQTQVMETTPIQNTTSSTSITKPAKELFIFLKVDGVQHKVQVDTIQYIEAFGNFVKINLPDKQLVTASTMNNMLQRLISFPFVRTHKSFIVNIDVIEKVEGNSIIIAGKRLPISTTYKQDVLSKIGLA